MSEIEEIQKKIAEIDKQINTILVEKRLPPLKPPKPFPLMTWILALVLLGYYLFGDALPYVGPYYQPYGEYSMYGALVVGVVALLRTLLWLFSRNPKTPPEYLEASRKVQDLQDQRRLLEKELRELRKQQAS